MPFLQLPVWANAVLLAAAAVLIWQAGSRLSERADQLASKTGLSRAFLGAALLGGITSLPELSTTTAVALLGNAELAVNNLLGGVSMQVVVLALADAAVRGAPLSAVHGPPAILLQGCLGILLLAVIGAGIAVGEVPVGPLGAWALAVTLLAIGGFALLHRRQRKGKREPPAAALPRSLGWRIGGAGALVLVGGVAAGGAADALAAQTGLGAGLVGFLFLALVTSLPEISTAVSASRLGQPGMAFSNIFGSNVIDLSFVGVADLLLRGSPALDALGTFSLFACLLGIVLTAIYLSGLIEREDRAVVRVGPDSIAVVLVYVAGVWLLSSLG